MDMPLCATKVAHRNVVHLKKVENWNLCSTLFSTLFSTFANVLHFDGLLFWEIREVGWKNENGHRQRQAHRPRSARWPALACPCQACRPPDGPSPGTTGRRTRLPIGRFQS